MRYLTFAICIIFVGCGSKHRALNDIPPHQIPQTLNSNVILSTGQFMVKNGEIIKGSCWDYIDELYTRSGYPRDKRTYIFKTAKNRPPYAPLYKIKAGDWLYFINHSYGKVEHSGIFVSWKDKPNAKAIILSYGGEHRNRPGRYRTYDIRDTFAIIRGVR